MENAYCQMRHHRDYLSTTAVSISAVYHIITFFNGLVSLQAWLRINIRMDELDCYFFLILNSLPISNRFIWQSAAGVVKVLWPKEHDTEWMHRCFQLQDWRTGNRASYSSAHFRKGSKPWQNFLSSRASKLHPDSAYKMVEDSKGAIDKRVRWWQGLREK